MLPNIGWLDPNTVATRLTGQGGSSSTTGVAPGTHGSSLVSTAVGTNTLEVEPTLNFWHYVVDELTQGGQVDFLICDEAQFYTRDQVNALFYAASGQSSGPLHSASVLGNGARSAKNSGCLSRTRWKTVSS